MKCIKIFILTMALLFVTSVVTATPSVSFQWLQASDNTWGTKVYIGSESGEYVNSEDAGINTTEYTLENLEYNKEYKFSATHYDPATGLESPYAEEITWTSPGPNAIVFNPLDKKKVHPIKAYVLKFIFK